jgi:hypothetical protein
MENKPGDQLIQAGSRGKLGKALQLSLQSE